MDYEKIKRAVEREADKEPSIYRNCSLRFRRERLEEAVAKASKSETSKDCRG